MGKRKITAKESEQYDNSEVTKVNGHMPKTSQSSRPKASCSAALASIVLVAALSIITGLILIEFNKSNQDLLDSLQHYRSEKHKKTLDDVEAPVLKKDTDTLKRPPPSSSTIPPSTRDKEKVETDKKSEEKPKIPAMDTVHEPEPKKIKKDEPSETKIPTDEKKIDSKRQEEIEKQIVSDKPKKTDDTKRTDVEQEKDTLAEKHSSSESEKLEAASSDTADVTISQEKEKADETNLEELYIEVENIAEEILQEDPENSMVKQLAPHLEGVLKDLEGGKLSGLRDSLLHMKLILTDLKERLDTARKDAMLQPSGDVQASKSDGDAIKPSGKKADSCPFSAEGEKVPVDEVIPDPVYISPLGDKEKSLHEKKEKDSSQAAKSKEESVSHMEKESKDSSQTLEKDNTESLKKEEKVSLPSKEDEKVSSKLSKEEVKISLEPLNEEDKAPKSVKEDKTLKPVKEGDKASSKSVKEGDKASLESVKDDKITSKPVKEEDKASKSVKEDKTSSKPVKEEDKASKSVKEDKTSSKSEKEKDKASSKSIKEDKTSSKPVKEEDKASKPVKEDKTSSKSEKEKDKTSSKPAKELDEVTSESRREEENKYKDKIPVDEVIPEPVYIKPLGETDEKIPQKTDQPIQQTEDKIKISKSEVKESSEKTISGTKVEDTKVKPEISVTKDKISEAESQTRTEPTKEIPKLKEDKKAESKSSKSVEQSEQKQQVPVVQTKEEKEIKKKEQITDGENKDKNQDQKDIHEPKEKEKEKEKPSTVPKSQDKVPPIVTEDKKTPESSQTSTSSIPRSSPSSEIPSKSHPKEVNTEKEEELEDKLNLAAALEKENAVQALIVYDLLVQEFPKSYQTLYRRAQLLDKLSESEKSNTRLEQAIDAYVNLLDLADKGLPKDLLKEAGLRCADRMYFRGRTMYTKKRKILRLLTEHFGDDMTILNQIGVSYLQIQGNEEAKVIFEKMLEISPDDGFALAHYGFILKIESNNNTEVENAIKYMERGINTHEPGVDDRRIYYHLGDALQRLGQNEKAYEVFDEAVKRGMFRNRYQRSTYNIDRLVSRPIWTHEETTYEKFFQKVQSHWEEISREAVFALELNKDNDPKTGYREEGENLQETGTWGIFELFRRGSKVIENCKAAPVTCSLIEDFPPAASCKRGQVKFSVMSPGTHVYPHTGPTNCRLRAHLGLVTPEGARMRVVNETMLWEEGKLFIFDDSYEHEVWHEGKTIRVVLIIDVWHPDLTEEEKNSLTAI